MHFGSKVRYMTSKIKILGQIQNFLKNPWEFPPNFWTNSRSSGQFLRNCPLERAIFLNFSLCYAILSFNQKMVSSFQKSPELQCFSSNSIKCRCKFWIWQKLVLFSLYWKVNMAMHNSEFDKNLDFSREFAEEIYPCPWSIFKCPSGSGKFQKLPSGSGKFLGKFPQKIKIFGTNFGPLRG